MAADGISGASVTDMAESGKRKPPETPRAERSKTEERRQRQARALRENLKKRRAQARDRRRDDGS